ncbi:MAG: RNA methyltransferase [Bacteroidota bacterium]
MNPQREQKLRAVALRRQFDFTVILENVFDTHNVGAVMRSCDSVGIREVFVLHSEEDRDLKRIQLGKRTSAGTRKWVKVHFYTDLEQCVAHVKSQYDKLLCTHLGEDSVSLYDLDLSASVALVFGNEHDGISKELLAHSDGNFIIPQMGMVQSLNISVACAVSLYEGFRQRAAKDLYANNTTATEAQRQALAEDYLEISSNYETGKFAYRINEPRTPKEGQ